MLRAELRAEASDGSKMAISNAMIPITTNNSISENAFLIRTFMTTFPRIKSDDNETETHYHYNVAMAVNT